MGFVRMDLVTVLAKFEVRRFRPTRSRFLGGATNPNLGEEEAVGGRGWIVKKR